jgi:serine/threonine protein kinase
VRTAAAGPRKTPESEQRSTMADQLFTGNLKPGSTLDKYEVREQVAAGGMAIIYKAYDPSLDRYVAIKQIAPHLVADEKFTVRFRTEAQTLARLSSTQANIVHVHELIQQDGQLYLIMEYVEGTTLRSMMDKGPVPLQTGLGVLLSTALGLRAMHAQGIVHRDLTPANIMLAKDGALKITDFGLIGHSGGRTSLPMGTTKYMAPEMFTGAPIDPRADLYSLGMIALEMFAGPEKFAEAFRDVMRDEKAQQVRWMHWHSNVGMRAPSLKELQPGIPPLVSKIVERLLDKDPSKRFPSADQVVRWLRKIFVLNVQGKSVTQSDSENLEKEMDAEAASPMPAAPLTQPKWTWQRILLWAAIIGGPLVLAAGGLGYWKISEENKRVNAAKTAVQVADELFNDKKFSDASKTFYSVAREYADVQNVALYAMQHAKISEAEQALADKRWSDADSAATQAQEKGASPSWLTEFRARFQKTKDIEERLITIDRLVKNGQYEEAITALTELAARYPELKDLNSRVAELRAGIEMREYRGLIAQAQATIRKNEPTSLTEGREVLANAQKKLDTPEVQELIKWVDNEVKLREIYAAAERDAAASKWDIAAKEYEEAYKLRSVEAIRIKMINAKAEACAAQARTLAQNGLMQEAAAKYTECLQFNPNHAEALEFLRKTKSADQLAGFIKAGDDAKAREEWDGAINSYNQALALIDGKDPNGAALKKATEDKIVECKLRSGLAKARRLLDQNNFAGARLALDGLGEGQEVKDLTAQINKREQYKMHLDLGKEFLGRAEYMKALAEFQGAQKIEATAEVAGLIAETQYRRNLAGGKLLLNNRKYTEAAATFRIAISYRDTPEAQAYKKQAEDLAKAKPTTEGGP